MQKWVFGDGVLPGPDTPDFESGVTDLIMSAPSNVMARSPRGRQQKLEQVPPNPARVPPDRAPTSSPKRSPEMKRTLLLAAAVGLSALANAQAPAKPDPAKAKEIVNQICAACHGADGTSPTSANPSLAGMPADYITTQLAHFKAGIRQNAIMQGMSSTLSDADMVSLGAYFAGQKPKLLEAKDASLAREGQRLWRAGDAANGVPACSACHGPTGAGLPRNYPRLSGQWSDYTLAQLKAFKSGERGMDKGGKDVNGQIMVGVARGMSEAQMKALADYAQGLR